jgi:hypothetical protein
MYAEGCIDREKRREQEENKKGKVLAGKISWRTLLENKKVVCKICARREARQRVGVSRALA